MNAVKVISIGPKKTIETQWGMKEKINMVIRDISMTDPKHNVTASMFVPKEGVWWKEGEIILAEIIKTDKYLNIKKVERYGDENKAVTDTSPIQKTEEKQEKKVEPLIAEEKVDWAAKERRMVRMNCLSHATELVKDALSFSEAKDLNKNVEDTKNVAKSLEDWVYRT